MKILEITVAHRSDDTRIYHKYIKSLLDAGFEVGYMAPQPIISGAANLKLFCLKKSKSLILRLFGLLKMLPAIRSYNPNWIHLHDPELLLVSPLLRFLGYKLIYDMHENFYRELDDKPISWVSICSQKLVWRLIEKYILKKTPVVFAEQSYAKCFDLEAGTLVVQNFPKEANVIERFQPKAVERSKGKFVYLGTISKDRGALKMIRVLDKAFGELDYELHFIGDITNPVLERELMSIFAHRSNVIFHGYQPLYDAWRICKECDVGLAILDPKENYIESYPTKLFEYLVCGLPVVTSNFELYKDLIERYGLGLCIDPNKEVDIASALIEIMDARQYSQFASCVESFPFHEFTWEREFEKFEAYLRTA